MKKEISTGIGIASFVLSLIGVFLPFIPYIGIVFSILAVVFAHKQDKIHKTGLGTAGKVIGIIGLVLNGGILLLMLLFGMFLGFAMSLA